MKPNILQTKEQIDDFITNSFRPKYFNKAGIPLDANKKPLVSEETLRANAFLNREEWEALDQQVIARAKLQLNMWSDVMGAGLVSNTTLAEWMSKWRVGSERTKAQVNMDFESQEDEDRVDRKTYGVPIPIISAKFSIGRRELMTARAHGTMVEALEADEASNAVTEKAEEILVDGDSSIVLQGNSIPGVTSLTARYSTTAEGDFGTLSNVYPTFTNAVDAMHQRRYYGPWDVYMHSTQYREMLDYYSDGSNMTGLDRVLAIPEIRSVKVNDLITAGEIVGIQMTRNVLDIRQALPLEVRQWEHPSGSRMHFVVLMAAVPRLKTDYAGYAGIFHLSSA